MKKNKNEMAYWLIFILILMGISISIILYFRLPKSLNYNSQPESFNTETVEVN